MKLNKNIIENLLSLKKTIIPGIILALATFLFFYRAPLELYPENETLFDFSAYADEDTLAGGSSTYLDTTKGHLHFSYKLNSNSEAPYAMLLFHAHELLRTIDIKRYRYIDLKIDPDSTYDFNLILSMYVPGFSNPSRTDTHRPYVMICRVKKGTQHYRYYFDDLATPGWWFSDYSTTLESIPPTDWRRMSHLSITDCGTAPLDSTLHFSMEELSFAGSFLPSIIYSCIALIIFLIIRILTSERIRRKNNRELKKKLYFPDSDKSYSDEDKENLIKFLNENFSDPILSLKKIQENLSLNSFQVNEILSDEFKMNYKKYVNYLRVEKSMDLLQNTDIPINAIAEKVGYCYSNSYSRVFKQFRSITPQEYRTSVKKS